jgi:hypothetical protein
MEDRRLVISPFPSTEVSLLYRAKQEAAARHFDLQLIEAL